MTQRPFKGKNGLSANGYLVSDVAPPENPTDASQKEWSETFIRLNSFNPDISYEAGTAVEFQGRIWYAADDLEPGPWDPDNWERSQQDEHWRTSEQSETLRASDSILYNSTTGAVTYTLPTSPTTGDRVVIFDFRELTPEYPVTVESPDRQIENSESTYLFINAGARLERVYTGSRWTAVELHSDLPVIARDSGFISPGRVTWVNPSSSITLTLSPDSRDGDAYTIVDLRPSRSQTVQIEEPGTGVSREFLRGERLEIVRDDGQWRYTSSRDLVNKVWRFINSNSAAAPGDRLLVDTSSGGVIITLPSNPVPESEIRIVDQEGNFRDDSVTLQRASGQTIAGLDENYTIQRNHADVTLVYDSGNWIVVEMESSQRYIQYWEATDGQSVFTVDDVDWAWRDLRVNGVQLREGNDYLFNSSDNLELMFPASRDDVVLLDSTITLGLVTRDISTTGLRTEYFTANDGQETWTLQETPAGGVIFTVDGLQVEQEPTVDDNTVTVTGLDLEGGESIAITYWVR